MHTQLGPISTAQVQKKITLRVTLLLNFKKSGWTLRRVTISYTLCGHQKPRVNRRCPKWSKMKAVLPSHHTFAWHGGYKNNVRFLGIIYLSYPNLHYDNIGNEVLKRVHFVTQHYGLTKSTDRVL